MLVNNIKRFFNFNFVKPKLIALITLVISVLLIVLNLEQLSFLPWENKVKLSRPRTIAINDRNEIAIVDNLQTRVILISNKNKIEGVIENSAISSVSPEYIESIALDDKYIYILDLIKTENGSSTTGYRVLVYDHNCKYVKTLIESDYRTSESRARIKSIDASKDKIYATFTDAKDESLVYVADISSGSLKDLRLFNCGGHDIYDITYIADYDVLTILTNDGYVYAWNKNEAVLVEFAADEYFFTCAILDSDNCLYVVDHNSRTLSMYYLDQWTILKENISGVDFVLKDYLFASIDNMANRISVYDFSNGEMKTIENPPLKLSSILFCGIIWLCLIYVAICFLYIVYLLIKKIFKFVKANEQTIIAKNDNRVLTNASLYGPIFGIVSICLIASVFIFGTYAYNELVSERKANVYNCAYTLAEISKIEFGDTLAKLNSQTDYDSLAYQEVIKTAKAVCMNNVDEERATDLNYIIYRFLDDSDYAMIVDEPYGDYRFGSLINPNDKITVGIAEGIAAAKKGEFYKSTTVIADGTVVYFVFAPIYDSNNKVVGTIAPLFVLSSVAKSILANLLVKCLELVTLIAGLAMIIAEFKLLQELYILQRNKHRNNDRSSLIEIDRSLKIFSRIPGSIICLFITLLGNKVLTNSGVENNPTLLALPLTVSSLSFALANSFGALVYKYKPKKYIRLGLLIELLASLVLIFSLTTNNYIILLIGSFLTGIGSGVCKTAVNTIRLTGRKVEPRYSLMVFCNMESGIAAAISGSLGSVFRNFFGDNGVLMIFVISCLVAIFINEYFIDKDIDIVRKVDKENTVKTKMLNLFVQHLSFAKQPTILLASLLMVLPFEVMRLFESFAMPLINEAFGYPDVFIGIITFIIEITIIFFAPSLKRLTRKFNGLTWLIPIYLTLALGLLIFALDGKMITFVIILIFESLVYPIVDSAAVEEFINKSEEFNLNANDTAIYRVSAASVGENLGPTILSFMLLAGSRIFGLVWCLILLACTGLIILCLYKAGQIKHKTI